MNRQVLCSQHRITNTLLMIRLHSNGSISRFDHVRDRFYRRNIVCRECTILQTKFSLCGDSGKFGIDTANPEEHTH